MSARKELAQAIHAHDRTKDPYPLADAILAAGYRKPRTITTRGELDALSEGTKLYSTKTTHSWELKDLSHPHGGVRVHGTGGGYTYLDDFITHEAPLTVLHTPEANQ